MGKKKANKGWKSVPLYLGGGKERSYKGGRIHKHWLRDDKHVDAEHPANSPLRHLKKDVLRRGKGAPIPREWVYRYRTIKGRKRLVMVRKERGQVKMKIVK